MVETTARIFADETKIFNRIITEENHQQMQADLNRLVNWSKEWQLGFNVNNLTSYI
jgi:hypothetical protein